jgi:hypothetical protein
MVQVEQSPQGDYREQNHNARLSILILSKAYPFHGILSHVTRLMRALMVVGKVFSWKVTKSRSLISTFSFQVLCDYPF